MPEICPTLKPRKFTDEPTESPRTERLKKVAHSSLGFRESERPKAMTPARNKRRAKRAKRPILKKLYLPDIYFP